MDSGPKEHHKKRGIIYPVHTDSSRFFSFGQGVTTADEWLQLRRAPSLWAELECDNIILTIPSSFIRNLEDPERLMERWNSIMKAVAELAVIPDKLPRKERIVADVQIKYGKCFLHYTKMAVHVNFLLHLYILDFMKN